MTRTITIVALAVTAAACSDDSPSAQDEMRCATAWDRFVEGGQPWHEVLDEDWCREVLRQHGVPIDALD
jgi:hypothetical protein